MPKKDIDFGVIVARAQEVAAERGISLYKASGIVAQETGLHRTTVYNRAKAMEQIPGPEPEQAANQEPDEGEGESATDSIPYSVERIENIGKDIPPVKMPIGCSLPREDGFTAADDKPIPYVPTPLEDSTESQDKEMAKGDTVGEEEAEEYVTLDIEWPPTDKVEKALIEASIKATFAVRRALNDPVALALMKQVLGSGVM